MDTARHGPRARATSCSRRSKDHLRQRSCLPHIRTPRGDFHRIGARRRSCTCKLGECQASEEEMLHGCGHSDPSHHPRKAAMAGIQRIIQATRSLETSSHSQLSGCMRSTHHHVIAGRRFRARPADHSCGPRASTVPMAPAPTIRRQVPRELPARAFRHAAARSPEGIGTPSHLSDGSKTWPRLASGRTTRSDAGTVRENDITHEVRR